MRKLLILALCASAHATPLTAYATLESAATAALTDAEAMTPDFEAGGAIYLCGDKYAYMAPVTQRKRDRVNVETLSTETCELAGLFHTHPRGDTRFSDADVKTICAARTRGFIKPHGAPVRVFDCRDVNYAALKRAGHPVYGTTI